MPASAWGPEQRALNMDMILIIRSQAADMKRLATRPGSILARLMREQAMYEDEFRFGCRITYRAIRLCGRRQLITVLRSARLA